jgi:hypothetical protein
MEPEGSLSYSQESAVSILSQLTLIHVVAPYLK